MCTRAVPSRAMTEPQDQPAPRQRRHSRLLLGAAVGVLLAAAAGVGVWYSTRPEPSPPAAVAQTPAAASPAPVRSPLQDDPVAQRVCPQALSLTADDPYNPDKMETLARATQASADLSLSRKGAILLSAVRLARASKGKESEFRDTLGMASAATELQTLCIEHGYQR
jgi:hypothetical protein